MDALLLIFRGPRKRKPRKRRIDENGNEVWEEEEEEEEETSVTTLLAYVNLKTSLMFSDLAVGVAVPIYTEVMRLDIGTLSMVRALAKALDLLVSFIVGFASDQTRSPFGRRLPYIAVGSIFAPISMWYLAAPPPEWNLNTVSDGRRQLYGQAASSAAFRPFDEVCVQEAARASNGSSHSENGCEALRQCLAAAIDEAQLPTWDNSPIRALQHVAARALTMSDSASSASLHLAAWFLLFFVVRHSLGHTLVTIPYDALGQELTSNSDSRKQLFAWKSVCNFIGLLAAYCCQFVAALLVATDIVAQAQLNAAVGAALMVISATWLLCIVRERPMPEKSGGKETVPFLATIYALARNRPYRNYLALRLWLTFAFHLPFFSRRNYLEYLMGFENAALANTLSAAAAQLTSFYSLPFFLRVVERRGKVQTLVGICAGSCAMATLFARIPPATFKAWRLYCLQPIVEGATQIALYTFPEWLLADVIDYDELIYGNRREGIFVVFDVNITQLMDILAGVLPGLILSAVGYRGNGGCSCGCGVKCPASYLRWSCPTDIGYACTAELSNKNPPFYGAPERQPPCTLQPQSVEETLQLFFYAIPAVCFALATFFAYRAPIDGDIHGQIREQLDLRKKGQHTLYDPVTGNAIYDDDRRSVKEAAMFNVVESFSDEEQAIAITEDGIRKLYCRIILNIAITSCGATALMVAPKILPLPKILVKLFDQLSIFAVALLIMLLLWQLLKLLTVVQSQEKLKTYANIVRFEGEGEVNPTEGRSPARGRFASRSGSDILLSNDHLRLREEIVLAIRIRLIDWRDRARASHGRAPVPRDIRYGVEIANAPRRKSSLEIDESTLDSVAELAATMEDLSSPGLQPGSPSFKIRRSSLPVEAHAEPESFAEPSFRRTSFGSKALNF